MSASGLEERIGTLLAQHRQELEQLVDQALERELNQLVEQRLAARNGEPAAKPAAPAPIPHRQVGNGAAASAKVCDGCGETKPEAAFEKYRRRCRDCRKRDRRNAAAEQAPAEPGRPAAITPTELRARVERNGVVPGDLEPWLVREGLAEYTPGGLTATARAVDIADGLDLAPVFGG